MGETTIMKKVSITTENKNQVLGELNREYCTLSEYYGLSPEDAQKIIDETLHVTSVCGKLGEYVPGTYTKSDLIGTLVVFREDVVLTDDKNVYTVGYTLNSLINTILTKDEVTLIYDDGDSFVNINLDELLTGLWNSKYKFVV